MPQTNVVDIETRKPKPQLLTADPVEQLERIDGADAVRRLVERFSVEDVHRWLSYEAARCNEQMPCRGMDEGQ